MKNKKDIAANDDSFGFMDGTYGGKNENGGHPTVAESKDYMIKNIDTLFPDMESHAASIANTMRSDKKYSGVKFLSNGQWV